MNASAVPLYSVWTWDPDANRYTPATEVGFAPLNINLAGLRYVLKELRGMGYMAHRVRDKDGNHHSDPFVLVRRTDCK